MRFVVIGNRDGAIMTISPVERVRERLPNAVLLAIGKGKKNPTLTGWQKVQQDSMADPAYLDTLNHGGNIGVLLGSVSGGLCAIDFDADADAEAFLATNPELAGSFRTRGARGCQVWIRAQGVFPPSGDAKNAEGRKVAEWRADGRQSVIWGVHPDGHEYRWLVDVPPLPFHFQRIRWLDWRGPWMPESSEPSDLRMDRPLARPGVIILPSGGVSILDCANAVFPLLAKMRKVFTRGGVVVEAISNPSGPSRGLVLEPLQPAGFRSRLESCGSVMAWRKGRSGGDVLQPTTCPEDMARALLASEPAREILPPIAAVTGCPVAIEDPEGNLRILALGYHAQLGGLLVTAGTTPSQVGVDEAIKALSGLLDEFDFQTPSDRSRALAAFIAPALVLGGFINGRIPADVAEADQSQAGKGFRQKLTAAIYNESPRVVAQRDGGVGSLDESFSQALIAGRPFIQLDNLRGSLNSPFLEAFFTADSIGARVPHRGEVPVDPRRFFIFASSNGIEATRDLANRSSFVRIRKRERFQFRTYPEGGLLEHVKKRQPYYLGCVFSVIAEWLAAGKPHTAETRHDFREWAQVLDWIVRRLFVAAPLLDGHVAAQERVSNPALVLLRALCLAATQDERGDEAFSASGFAELAEAHGITIPGVRAGQEDRSARQVGIHLGRLFKVAEEIDVDSFLVRRSERLEVRQDSNGSYPVKTYGIARI